MHLLYVQSCSKYFTRDTSSNTNKQLREGKYGYLSLVDMGSKPRALNTLGAPYMHSHLRMSGLSPVVMWKGKDDFQPGERK